MLIYHNNNINILSDKNKIYIEQQGVRRRKTDRDRRKIYHIEPISRSKIF